MISAVSQDEMLTCVDAITEHFQRRADCLRQRLTRPAHGTSEVCSALGLVPEPHPDWVALMASSPSPYWSVARWDRVRAGLVRFGGWGGSRAVRTPAGGSPEIAPLWACTWLLPAGAGARSLDRDSLLPLSSGTATALSELTSPQLMCNHIQQLCTSPHAALQGGGSWLQHMTRPCNLPPCLP